MKKILIIDDSTFMRNVIKDILLSNSDKIPSIKEYQFYEADGKPNAIKKLQKEKPDVILLDIVMQESEYEGIEFLEAIKPFYDVSKVIIISSIGQNEVIDRCKELGVYIYIQKPIQHEQIIEAVIQIMK